MLKVGIIGCGRIADAHAVEILKVPGAKLVAACDREPLMAKQLCERFRIGRPYGDVAELLARERPDIVHVTSPPHTHLDLGRQCLEAGCSVMFEKPFALHAGETEELIGTAEKKGLKITVDHNVQFTPAARTMRELVRSGYLGGPPVHVESVWCYSYGDAGYAKALLGEKTHWVRMLPGKMLQNIASHGISKIAEFLTGESLQVMAHGFSSKVLRDLDETEIMDELRVIIHDSQPVTAYFTFSTQVGPPLHQLRLYGPKASLVVDDLHETLVRVTGNYKSYLNHFIPPLIDAGQHLRNSLDNIAKFIRGDGYFEAGRKHLIESFYRSVSQGAPVPIPYREILLVSRIMDRIFAQLENQKTSAAGLSG